jgi:phage tail sheath protein FI
VRPGVNVTTRDTAPPSTIPTDVGTGFMVGVTEAGQSGSVTVNDLVHNMDEYEAKYAPSGRAYTPGMTMYDSAETFFAEGGNRLYIGRVFGATAVAGTVTLQDITPAPVLVVTARGVGDWANGIDVVIRTNAEDTINIPSGQYRIRLVRESDGKILYESYNLSTLQDAIDWAFNNPLVSIAGSTGTGDPAAGTFDLSTGTNDIAGINNTSWQVALDSLSYALGPGILFAPGATTSTIYNMLAEAARRDLRVAFLDAPDTKTISTLVASAGGVVDSSLSRTRYAGMFAPWLIASGIASSNTRKLPPSPAVAGRFARNMADGISANEPAAGELGDLRSALDMTQVYTDAERETLNVSGVNVIRDIYGAKKVYGWRTVADPVNDPRWIALSNSIMHRQIVAEANAVGERFIFRQIDGQGRLIGEFGASLIGNVCMPFYQEGSLYGATPQEAFVVDVGPSVNTPATIANNELRAIISVRMSPFGEEVNIEIVKYLVTEALAA